VINDVVEVLFADDIVLCAPTRSQLKKLLKFVSWWPRNNEIHFSINKCSSLLVRGEVSRFLNNSNTDTFYLSSRDTRKYIGLYWIEGFSNGNSFTFLYRVSKELNIPPLSAKCAIAQVRW